MFRASFVNADTCCDIALRFTFVLVRRYGNSNGKTNCKRGNVDNTVDEKNNPKSIHMRRNTSPPGGPSSHDLPPEESISSTAPTS